MARRKQKLETDSPRPTKSVLDERGHEIPDPNPLALALTLDRSPTLAERIRQEIRSQTFASQLHSQQETFEEADDFDVGDDYDPSSPYEEEFEGQFDTRPQAAPAKPEPEKKDATSQVPPEPTPRSESGSA